MTSATDPRALLAEEVALLITEAAATADPRRAIADELLRLHGERCAHLDRIAELEESHRELREALAANRELREAMDAMRKVDLDKIEQLHDSATPGPWTEHPKAKGGEEDPYITFRHPDPELGDVAVFCDAPFWCLVDAGLVVELRNAIPALLVARDALRKAGR